jgi:hypothetical protein
MLLTLVILTASNTLRLLQKRISFRFSRPLYSTTATNRSLRNSTWRTGICTTDLSSVPSIVLERKIQRRTIRICLTSYSFKVYLLSLAFRGSQRITSDLKTKSKISLPFSIILRPSLENKKLLQSWVILIRKCRFLEKISNNILLKALLLNHLP